MRPPKNWIEITVVTAVLLTGGILIWVGLSMANQKDSPASTSDLAAIYDQCVLQSGDQPAMEKISYQGGNALLVDHLPVNVENMLVISCIHKSLGAGPELYDRFHGEGTAATGRQMVDSNSVRYVWQFNARGPHVSLTMAMVELGPGDLTSA